MNIQGRAAVAIDHFTLELNSGKSHCTWFKQGGKRDHYRDTWRLSRLSDGIDLWFLFATKLSILGLQVGSFEFSVTSPKSDDERRTAEFIKFAEQCKQTLIEVPQKLTDTVLCFVSLMDDKSRLTPDSLRESFRLEGYLNDIVIGWPDGTVPTAATIVEFEGLTLLFAVISPPGELANDFVVNFANGSSLPP